jgi:glycosyltransferase involved in cell wall biosynthesis
MNILFLDQSGNPGGAELCLLDIAQSFTPNCLVGLMSDGPFRTLLEERQIPIKTFGKTGIILHKDSGFLRGLGSLIKLLPIVSRISYTARNYQIIYSNTPKALVSGALASVFSRKALVYHLHDIISQEHFSLVNCYLMVTLANHFASLVIANSEASRNAYISAGGRAELVSVVYNGFDLNQYSIDDVTKNHLQNEFNLHGRFVIGHFSRLSPWKGQHILIEALKDCPEQVVAFLVGDALFGEEEYVATLHQQVETLGLQDRVKFLGFRNNIPQLMAACSLVTHTSISPEPFGRVIVEAMLCGTPIVASAAGGATELVDHGRTGWLCPPSNPQKLAELINYCITHHTTIADVAVRAKAEAVQRFDLQITTDKITNLLRAI